MYTFGDRSRKYLDTVDVRMQRLAELALKYSTVDFSVIDGLRTVEQQQKLYAEGNTELDGISKKSAHQSGMAIDVIPYISGIDVWDVNNPETAKAWLEVYRAFGRASMKLGECMELGLWYNIGNGRDYPHIQLVDKL